MLLQTQPSYEVFVFSVGSKRSRKIQCIFVIQSRGEKHSWEEHVQNTVCQKFGLPIYECDGVRVGHFYLLIKNWQPSVISSFEAWKPASVMIGPLCSKRYKSCFSFYGPLIGTGDTRPTRCPERVSRPEKCFRVTTTVTGLLQGLVEEVVRNFGTKIQIFPAACTTAEKRQSKTGHKKKLPCPLAMASPLLFLLDSSDLVRPLYWTTS